MLELPQLILLLPLMLYLLIFILLDYGFELLAGKLVDCCHLSGKAAAVRVLSTDHHLLQHAVACA